MAYIKRIILSLAVAALLLSCNGGNDKVVEMLIPQPTKTIIKSGKFSCETPVVFFNNVADEDKENLMSLIKGVYPSATETTDSQVRGVIRINQLPYSNNAAESYDLCVSRSSVDIDARTPAGLIYGIQTLAQLNYLTEGNGIPCLIINDTPRFAYRGLHLDVSRHFYSVEFLKKQLDVMSFYKMNRFHWHLTDGAGWRIEIKKYPRLTNFAAWRPYNNWKEFWFGERLYCDQTDERAKGGYYTQEDVKEVVAYAQKLNITVIPEIEMPGHSDEVLAAYPNLSCKGKPYTSGEVCIGNEDTYKFLTDVLSEVCELFPSEYIHIGGDEADHKNWKECSKCQNIIRTKGLKNEHELQSYLIQRIENFLSTKGKKLIGWDEIIEGGLSPYATVMAWRGEAGGIKAAQMGHDAIMTPGNWLYFDAYQDNPATEPEAIGGYLPLSRVYSYEPVPDSLSLEEKSHIVGVQANIWTEYIQTEEHAEYMIYPRLLALSELGWCMADAKDWDRFLPAANKHLEILKAKGINAHQISNSVIATEVVDVENKKIELSFRCDKMPVEIRYTEDGTEPTKSSTLYKSPISIKDSATVKVAIFQNDERITEVQTFTPLYHKAIGKKVSYNIPHCSHYVAKGEATLTDGYNGGASYGDGSWQGFNKDVDVVLDMGEVTEIKAIEVNFMQQAGPWIWFPEYVDIYMSEDGENWRNVKHIDNDVPRDTEGLLIQNFGFNGNESCRYIRYTAHQLPKEGAYMFIDEIKIK